ncbi:lactoylglutathione lyase [Malassezia nana]|uniref:Lactoylglutathione lyase n=1 Tax=Malassezia nana TaxID=180528 RepID=A0AAF0ESH0_9BASI|nr:lactoylglutathione lyase [Malassezia nana]
MSNPWRETQGYSFHSICLRVKDIEESTMFYQEVFGMDLVREADLGRFRKVWMRFPTNKDTDMFGHAHSLIELVQESGTEFDPHYHVQARGGGFQHICFSVPDIYAARHRFERLGVHWEDLGFSHSTLILVYDPDGYPIQIMSQSFDLHASLQDVCRQIVIDGVEQANMDIRRHGDRDTREEAGLTVQGHTPCSPATPASGAALATTPAKSPATDSLSEPPTAPL